MKKYILLIISLFIVINISAVAQQKSLYKYLVLIDLGSDYSDPLFSDYTLKDYIKERMTIRLPEFEFTEFEDANVVLKFTMLTKSSSEVNNNFVSALNLLITSPFHNPLNWNVLLIETKDEQARMKIKDLLDRWILEYSAFIYKSTK
ncbi:MAG: hypothetical protein ACK4G1_06295 [Ignavibacteria bacterium]